MDIANEPIFQWLSTYAYQPEMVYASIILLMFASSFGFPLPEEVPLISAGLLAYMATHPEQFPPPTPDSVGVEPYTLALVCFLAVFLSDLVIYGLGRLFGETVTKSRRISKVITPSIIEKVENWTQRYGMWAVAIFRFTPGIRFPGHMACGLLKFPLHKFVLVDGTAALLSVPTQIFLVAYYGETILVQLQRFKIVLGFALIVLGTIYLLLKLRNWAFPKDKSQAAP